MQTSAKTLDAKTLDKMTLHERSDMMALVADALEATAEKAYEIGDDRFAENSISLANIITSCADDLVTGNLPAAGAESRDYAGWQCSCSMLAGEGSLSTSNRPRLSQCPQAIKVNLRVNLGGVRRAVSKDFSNLTQGRPRAKHRCRKAVP